MVRFLKYIFFHIACDNLSIRKLILAKINLLKKWNWHYFTLLVMDLLSPSKYFIWNKAKRANLKTGIRRKQSKTNFPKNEHFLILATPVLRFALLFYYRRFELVKLLIVSNIQLYFMLNNSPIIFIVASEKRYIMFFFRSRLRLRWWNPRCLNFEVHSKRVWTKAVNTVITLKINQDMKNVI